MISFHGRCPWFVRLVISEYQINWSQPLAHSWWTSTAADRGSKQLNLGVFPCDLSTFLASHPCAPCSQPPGGLRPSLVGTIGL